MTERPWTVKGLASHWQCSTQHVYNLCARGDLAHNRLGRLIRIPAAAVREFDELQKSDDSEKPETPSTPSGPSQSATDNTDDAVFELRLRRALRRRPTNDVD